MCYNINVRKTVFIVLLGFAFFLLLSTPTLADIISPTRINLYFQKNNRPYNEPLDFEVVCYGYSWMPVVRNPDKLLSNHFPHRVFSLSANYKRYGEQITRNIYLNYITIEWCEIIGNTNGKEFQIKNLPKLPLENCEWLPGIFGEEECDLKVDLDDQNFQVDIAGKIKRGFLNRINLPIDIFDLILIRIFRI